MSPYLLRLQQLASFPPPPEVKRFWSKPGYTITK